MLIIRSESEGFRKQKYEVDIVFRHADFAFEVWKLNLHTVSQSEFEFIFLAYLMYSFHLAQRVQIEISVFGKDESNIFKCEVIDSQTQRLSIASGWKFHAKDGN